MTINNFPNKNKLYLFAYFVLYNIFTFRYGKQKGVYMKRALKIFLILLAFNFVSFVQLKYPKAHKDNIIDNYFGTKVPAPYQWMENINSKAVRNWINEEKKITENYFSKIPFRTKLKKRFTQLWNYERYSAPRKEGKYYFFSKNNGLQEQSGTSSTRV